MSSVQEIKRFVPAEGEFVGTWIIASVNEEGLFRIWAELNDLWFRWDKRNKNWIWLKDGPDTKPQRRKKVDDETDWSKAPPDVLEMLIELRDGKKTEEVGEKTEEIYPS